MVIVILEQVHLIYFRLETINVLLIRILYGTMLNIYFISQTLVFSCILYLLESCLSLLL